MTQNVPVKTQPGAGAPATRVEHPYSELRRQVDRLFDDFGLGFWNFPFGRGARELTQSAWGGEHMPQVDVSESAEDFKVKAELPGIAEKDVEVTITDDILTLKGEKKSEREDKRENYYLSERSFGSFSRSLRLPEAVDQNKITAAFDKGVLTVVLPKSEPAKSKSKKIEVKST